MPQVDFYHLTQSTLDDALVMLVKKCQVAGKRSDPVPPPGCRGHRRRAVDQRS